jgi:hypothetical protein
LKTRDFKTYEFEFINQRIVDQVFEKLKLKISNCSTRTLQEISLAFKKKKDENEKDDSGKRRGKSRGGWNIYNVREEFETRMGIGTRSKAWRFTSINKDFKFCPSYPETLIVPLKISDTTLNYAVKYRSKSRIPSLVYLHWSNLGSITRSSQPMVGITQTSRSIQDEKLIELIFTSHNQHSGTYHHHQTDEGNGGGIIYGAMATNVIIDARPTKNAYANSVKGAGTENMTFYKNCRKEYLGIDNIHVMRNSLNNLFQAFSSNSDDMLSTLLKKSNWLNHLTNILEGVLIVVKTVHLYNSHCLVHCSDGWDRTSQLSSLPQICLDPFYRTGKGFAVLIEKDWIAYGHKFKDRTGYLCNDRIEFISTPGREEETTSTTGTTTSTSTTSNHSSFFSSVQKQFTGSSHAFKETCPVFQQFLDCIYQLMKQFPKRFQFNEFLLRELVKETYSGKTGSFLFNSEAERFEYNARETTCSVWEEIFIETEGEGEELELKPQFRNPLYDPSLNSLADGDQGVLIFDPQKVQYWFELFGKTDSELNKHLREEREERRRTAQAQTEHVTVTSARDDPVLMINPSSSSRQLGSSTSSDSLPLGDNNNNNNDNDYSRSNSPLPPPQSEIAETVTKLGWSAWKTVQKLGQEAAKQYKERTIVNNNNSDNNGGEIQQQQQQGWSSSSSSSATTTTTNSNHQDTGGGGGVGGMWSRFSSTLGSSNPWQQSSSEEQETTLEQHPSSNPSYTRYQSKRSTLTNSNSNSYSTTSTMSTPTPPTPLSRNSVTRQDSNALSINPWETISKEEALPITASLPSTATATATPIKTTRRSEPTFNGKKVVEEEETSSGGGGRGDPLGVGGF